MSDSGGGGSQGGALAPLDADILGRADKIHAIQIEVRGGFRKGPQRVLAISFAAEQTLLFAADQQEHLAAFGGMLHRRLRHDQHRRGAGSIINGAVPDLVARPFAFAQMIPVGGVDHDFFFQFRVGSRHHARNVSLIHHPHRADHMTRGLQPQGHRLKILALSLGQLMVQILTTQREEFLRGIKRHPAFQVHAPGAFRQLKALLEPAILHHVPAVGCRGVRVDEQDARGAAALGLLELVGPAAVIGQGLPAEAVGFLLRGLRIIHQHHQNFPVAIQPLVIVPGFLGSRHAITHEDQGRIEGRLQPGAAGAEDDVIAKFKGHAGFSIGEHQIAFRNIGFDTGYFHVLAIALAIGGFQAHRCQLCLQIAHGDIAAPLTGSTALQQVIGKKGQVRTQWRFLDLENLCT